jgi:hypothetical protein
MNAEPLVKPPHGASTDNSHVVVFVAVVLEVDKQGASMPGDSTDAALLRRLALDPGAPATPGATP